MKVPLTFACTAFILLNSSAFGAVNFFEGFENPLVDGSGVQRIPTGDPVTLDNPGWVVLNSDDPGTLNGVFVTTWPSLSTGSGDQTLALGGGNTAGSSVSILVSGFTSMELPSISFDHWVGGTGVERLVVTVTDPAAAEAVIWSSGPLAGGSVNDSFDSSPVGDTVRVTITQGGDTVNSDVSIDNLTITAVPEPSLALLGVLGLLIGVTRRRR